MELLNTNSAWLLYHSAMCRRDAIVHCAESDPRVNHSDKDRARFVSANEEAERWGNIYRNVKAGRRVYSL